jgi:hypothetical protein
MSMKNSNVTIGNRTSDLPSCSECLNQLRHQQRARKEQKVNESNIKGNNKDWYNPKDISNISSYHVIMKKGKVEIVPVYAVRGIGGWLHLFLTSTKNEANGHYHAASALYGEIDLISVEMDAWFAPEPERLFWRRETFTVAAIEVLICVSD